MIDPQARAILDFLQESQEGDSPDRLSPMVGLSLQEEVVVLKRSLGQAIDWIRAYCEREIEEPEPAEETETTPFDDERASTFDLSHLMPTPEEETPQLIYPSLQFAKVTAIFKTDDTTWTDSTTDGFPSHCEALGAQSDEVGGDKGIKLVIKLTEGPANATVGYANITVGDTIGYMNGDYVEEVPGRTDAAGNPVAAYANTPWLVHFTGYIIAEAGDSGATPSLLRTVPFLCLVTKDAGVSGGAAAECTWTYTVEELDDATEIGTGLTPEVPRLHFVAYWYAGETRTAPAVATSRYALAAYDGETLKLLVCFGEIAKEAVCA